LPPLIEPDEWREVIDRFNTKWNFPHAFGALDGKHIPIKAPPKSGSLYYSYTGFFSIHDPSSISRCQLQVYMGISGEVWLSIRLPSVQRFRIKGVGRML